MALAITAGPAAAAASRPAETAARRPAEIGNKVFVKTATVHKYGKVLVDQKGLALYYNTDDKPSHWACTGACLVVWPPLTLPPGETLAQLSNGIIGLGTVPGLTGRQVTWHGRPLYTFSHDSPGTVKGEGTAHIWYVVRPLRAPRGAGVTATTGSSY
jgi:predicted lipoprotein with Yx(FWY)xxD motif